MSKHGKTTSGGIIALRGFDYQSTVVLDLLFNLFNQYQHNVSVRPEGEDDLDIRISDSTGIKREFFQIKKPREDDQGNLSPRPWTLTEVINQLLPNTIRNLQIQNSTQHWIVGDTFDQQVEKLITCGEKSPIEVPSLYWDVVHRLARNFIQCDTEERKKINKIKIKDAGYIGIDPLNVLDDAFANELKLYGVNESIASLYSEKTREIHDRLPNVLKRIVLCPTFGKEEEIIYRVNLQLEEQYKIPEKVSQKILFRNLRGFINDISKEYDKTFDRKQFEFELASVWPSILHISEPQQKPLTFISRAELNERILSQIHGKAIEITGISGSGKTLLASDAIDYIRSSQPQALAFYSEVREEGGVSLRDVLCGLAFTLQGYGAAEPFSIAITPGLSEEHILQRLGDVFNRINVRVFLFIDFASGVCSRQFSHDLVCFLRANTEGMLRLVLLGQERSLYLLDKAEQQSLNIAHFSIPGLTSDEFIQLVQAANATADAALLCNIYEKLTAGRDAGLQASLANLLASRSIAEMGAIAQLPNEEMVPAAERLRFSELPDDIRNTTGKLSCFMLPFTREEAAGAFPDLNTGMAISFLLDKGLLQSTRDDTLEMHEIVRKGIHALISPQTVTDSHRSLAAWYKNKPIARFHHLLQAGEKEEADRLAQEAFSRDSWHAIIDYLCNNSLLTIGSVFASIASRTYPTTCPLDNLLRRLGDSDPIPSLLTLASKDQEYFNTDFNWSMNLGRAISKHSIEHFFMLLAITIDYAKKHPENEHTALDWAYLFLERDSTLLIPEKILETFKEESFEIKKRLIPLLLLDKRRELIKLAMELKSEEPAVDAFNEKKRISFPLHIKSKKDAVEFLASVPDADGGQMMATRSAVEGWIGDYIWTSKDTLTPYCKDLLKNHHGCETQVLKNALRVLIHIADKDAIKFARPFIKEGHALHGFSVLLPVFFPEQIDIGENKRHLFDVNTKIQDRLIPLTLLAAAGEDLNELYATLKSLESEKNHEQIDIMFSLLSLQHQCDASLGYCEKILKDDKAYPPIINAQLSRLAESTSISSLEILLKALTHKSPQIRLAAATVLSQRRESRALPQIFEQLELEKDETVAIGLVVAAMASGISSLSEAKKFPQTAAALSWKCKLIGRIQDTSSDATSLLINTACDTNKHWEVRRSAILATSHLPFSAALEHICYHILKEQSPLNLDRSTDLIAHNHLRDILLKEGKGLFSTYSRGEKYFTKFWGNIFSECWSDTSAYDIPEGKSISAWLYHKLQNSGFPGDYGLLDKIINELSIPVLHDAILRALAAAHQYELIEKVIAESPNTWMAIRGICARVKAGNFDESVKERLTNIVNSSPYKNAGHGILYRVIPKSVQAEPNRSKRKKVATYLPNFPINEFSYNDDISIIKNMAAGSTLIVKAQSVENLHTLLHKLEENVKKEGVEKRAPRLKIKADGSAIIGHAITYSSSGSDTIKDKIISSIAACFITFGITPDWHIEKMNSQYSHTYMLEYAKCLAVLESKDFFYEQIASNEELLLCVIKNYLFFISQPGLITDRIISLLSRYINAGTLELFEGICALACQIKTNRIDFLLSALLRRWSKEKSRIPFIQNDISVNLARAFNQMSTHPRFYEAADWLGAITTVLQAGVRWYERKDFFEVMGKHPKAYSQIEAQLLHTTVDQHFLRDEIDQLDEDAQRLFKQVAN